MSESVPEPAVMQSSTVDMDQKVGKGQYSHYHHGEEISVGLEASDSVTLRMEEPLGTSDLWERPGPLEDDWTPQRRITTLLKIKAPKAGFHSDAIEDPFWFPSSENNNFAQCDEHFNNLKKDFPL